MPVGGTLRIRSAHFAEELGLPVAHKPDSQEICFVRMEIMQSSLRRTLERRFQKEILSGQYGTVIGKHKGNHALYHWSAERAWTLPWEDLSL